MSQWVLNSEKESVHPEGETQNPLNAEETTGSPEKPELPKVFSGWTRVVPFLLSAAFFLSRFFAVFSPLPLLMLFAQKGRRWTWFAVLTNTVLVGLLGGTTGLLFYVVFVVSMSLSLPEMLLRKKSLILSAAVSLLAMGLCGFVILAAHSLINQVHIGQELVRTVSEVVDSISKSLLPEATWMDPSEIELIKKSLVLEFPSAVATFGLILVWANLVLLLKANPNQLREKIGFDLNSLRKWKAPEFMVWPTLLCGFFLLGDFGLASDIALNVFKFLLAVYVIQGLSIMSFFLELWGVKGFFRAAGLLLPVVLSAPLVAGLGFFDLWFDFRSKFRHS